MDTARQSKQGNGTNLFRPMELGLANFRREMDRAVERAWRTFGQGSFFDLPETEPWPAIDIAEGDKAITLRVDAPGLEAKDIDVEVTGNQLTIRGSREEQTTEQGKGLSYQERRTGSFARTIALPDYVDADKLEAKYDKGVLTLTAPKVAGSGAKRVAVKTT